MSTPIASLQPNNNTQPPIKSDIDDPIVQQVIGEMDPQTSSGSQQQQLPSHTQHPQSQSQQQQQPPHAHPQQPQSAIPQVYLKNDGVGGGMGGGMGGGANETTYDMVKQSIIVAIIALVAFYPATMDFVRKVVDVEAINDNEFFVRAVLVAIGYYAIFYLAKV